MGLKHVSQAAAALDSDRRRITNLRQGTIEVDLLTELACKYLLNQLSVECAQNTNAIEEVNSSESVSKSVVIDPDKADKILEMLSVMHEQNIQTEHEREKPDEQTLADLKKKLQAAESENKSLSKTRDNIQRQLQASESDLESAQDANIQLRQQIAEQVQEKLQAQLIKFLNLQKELVKVNSELHACKSSLDDSAILFYFLLRLMVTPT